MEDLSLCGEISKESRSIYNEDAANDFFERNSVIKQMKALFSQLITFYTMTWLEVLEGHFLFVSCL